jgi:hypothetical protein
MKLAPKPIQHCGPRDSQAERDEKYEDDFDGNNRESDEFYRAKIRIKLLVPRRWLPLGEHLVARIQNSLCEFKFSGAFYLMRLIQWVRRKFLVRDSDNRPQGLREAPTSSHAAPVYKRTLDARSHDPIRLF